MNKIYIVWDRHFNIVWGVTIKREVADAEANELNSREDYERYVVIEELDLEEVRASYRK